mgnify:CR=1 FL=1
MKSTIKIILTLDIEHTLEEDPYELADEYLAGGLNDDELERVILTDQKIAGVPKLSDGIK